MLLIKLHEAERATSSAEILSSTLKDTVTDMPSAANLSISDAVKISKQKDILLKELEAFRNLRRTIEHLLKTTAYSKSNIEETMKHIEVLLDMILEDESENSKLKIKLKEKEIHLQEISILLQKEKDTAEKTSQLSKSIEATQAHLQSQIQKKDADNGDMTAKIQCLTEKMSEQKMEIKELKHQIVAVKKKSAHEKEALKKAGKVLKKRARHFEAANENVNSQIREKDIALCEVLSATNVWKSHHELAVEEKTVLEVQVESLTQQITDMLTTLQKSKDHARASKEELLEKCKVVSSENEDLNHENARLKASVDNMEKETSSVESEYTELREKLKQVKSFVEQYETQVHKIQSENEKLKCRFEKVLHENKQISESKDLGTEKVMGQMEAQLKDLEHVPGLLEAADQSLQECEERLLMSKREYTGQSNTVAQLWDKVDANTLFLKNHSLEVENSQIQKKLVDLNQKVEKMIKQNQELKDNLTDQEQRLHNSEFLLEEKSRERCALIRLLETAVEDGKKQVLEEREKITSREQVLEKRMLDLETELRKKNEEKKQIACTLSITEKHYDLRLKGLKHNLEQTESKNQRIQNYVQLLKSSYATMFG